MDKPFRTVYLQIANNFVTDIVDVETQDYCKVQLKLSYRLNFEGASERWFSVENYVKLLCDNMRSMIRNRVRRISIKEFYHEASDILRDLILGVAPGDNATAKSQRPGRAFEANGMRIFDVEVLEVKLDKDLQTLLEAQERATMRQTLELEELQRRARFTEASKDLQSIIIDATEAVKRTEEEAKRKRLEDEATTKVLAQKVARDAQEAANVLAQLIRDSKKADHGLQVESQQAVDALRVAMLRAETAATKERMAAISPDLVAALQAFGDQATIERLAEAMSAQAFLRTVGGESIVDILTKALQGTGLADRLPGALNGRVAAVAKQLTT
jgi:major vault protein